MNARQARWKILTHAQAGRDTAKRRGRVCRCANCSLTAPCTPGSDFYGMDGQPFLCETCICTEAAIRLHWPETLTVGNA